MTGRIERERGGSSLSLVNKQLLIAMKLLGEQILSRNVADNCHVNVQTIAEQINLEERKV